METALFQLWDFAVYRLSFRGIYTCSVMDWFYPESAYFCLFFFVFSDFCPRHRSYGSSNFGEFLFNSKVNHTHRYAQYFLRDSSTPLGEISMHVHLMKKRMHPFPTMTRSLECSDHSVMVMHWLIHFVLRVWFDFFCISCRKDFKNRLEKKL